MSWGHGSLAGMSRWWWVVLLAACHAQPIVNGGAMLNVQPAGRPQLVGAYDFDLLGSVRGKACLRRPALTTQTVLAYWVGTLPFEGTPPKDPLTLGAIAAASTDAIDKISGADTILVTRVLTESSTPDEVCAYVYGRAVRIKKVGAKEKPEPDTDLERQDRDDHDDTKDAEPHEVGKEKVPF